jgi:hypothetical protein
MLPLDTSRYLNYISFDILIGMEMEKDFLNKQKYTLLYHLIHCRPAQLMSFYFILFFFLQDYAS